MQHGQLTRFMGEKVDYGNYRLVVMSLISTESWNQLSVEYLKMLHLQVSLFLVLLHLTGLCQKQWHLKDGIWVAAVSRKTRNPKALNGGWMLTQGQTLELQGSPIPTLFQRNSMTQKQSRERQATFLDDIHSFFFPPPKYHWVPSMQQKLSQ